MTKTFTVTVGEFEGPLPLLLELIEKRQLSINQVSLAQVADSFIDHVRQLKQSSLAELAEFIVMASTLMLIKSISLLPMLPLEAEETEGIDDLRRRLELYQLIRDRALVLRDRFNTQPIFYSESRRQETVFSPTVEITVVNLLAAMKSLIQSLPPSFEILRPVVIKKMISLEEMIKDLASRMQIALRMYFSDFIKDKKEKVNIIVGFLALLELCKQGLVEAEQSDNLDEIKIETKMAEIPRY